MTLSVTTAQTFAFEDFDAPKTKPKTASAPPPPDPALLAKARADGLAEGRRVVLEELEAKRAAAEAKAADAQAAALNKAAEAFEALTRAEASARRTVETAAARLIAAFMQRIIPGLADHYAAERAAAFLREIARAATGSNRLVLRAGAQAAALASQAQAQARAGAFTVTLDDTLPEHAVVAEWDNASCAWDPGEESAEIERMMHTAQAALLGQDFSEEETA